MDTAADIKKEDKKGSYRDSVATITKDGKRNYINPKKPKGRLYNLRTRFSIFYLLVFFSLPFIKVNEEPLLMLNILERKFIIFGLIFWPQDFFIFGIGQNDAHCRSFCRGQIKRQINFFCNRLVINCFGIHNSRGG